MLGVSSDTLKGIVHHHLPQQYKFLRKKIGTDSFYNDTELFTTIPGACKVILGSTHPDKHDVLDSLVENIMIYKIRHGKHKKLTMLHLTTVYLWLKPIETIHFVFKLDEPELLGSKTIAYKYACILQCPWHMKNGNNNFHEKHPGSIIILK